MGEEKRNLVHNVILEGREKLSISGVEDVDSFDENAVVVYTEMGMMEIKGNDLHMNKLNLESGEIVVDGEVDSVVYVDETAGKQKEGFFKKLLK